MNKDIIEGEWTNIKGKIKAKWGQLTDDEIESLKGNLEQIKGKIQKSYGYSKEKADKDFEDFQHSIKNKQ